MDKELTNKIREFKAMQNEEKRSRQVKNTFTEIKWMVQRSIEKVNIHKFNQIRFIVGIRVIGE